MIEKRQRAEAEKEEEMEFALQLDVQRQCVDAIEAEKMRRIVRDHQLIFVTFCPQCGKPATDAVGVRRLPLVLLAI